VAAIIEPLAESERTVLREAERHGLLDLDEDELIAQHSRVRRARDKYVKLYRRQASARVAEVGGRGAARPKNQRNAYKAELFEDSLARVSRQLAVVARRSAAELRADRPATARAARMPVPGLADRQLAEPPRLSRRTTRAQQPSPGVRKQRASTQAAGARRQAQRDSR
jgi:hypothetical protein